jgi:hypothetical protein
MKNRQLLIVGGLVVVSLGLALVLTSMFSAPAHAPVQPHVHPTGPEPVPVVRQTDGSDIVWTLNPIAGGRPAVADSGSTEAKPEIVVKTDIRRPRAGEVQIGLILEGRNGQQYQPGVMKGKTRMPAPKLRIVNEAGEVILDDSFQYG